ncbi:MAG: YidH family protein [Bacteroidota bacterium]
MDNPKNDTKLREHLANERTFLAWVRTAVALIGLGFVIVKFALFINEMSVLFHEEAVQETEGFSSVIGIIIVAFGVCISPFAFYEYKKVEKQINKQAYKASSFPSAILTMAIVAGGILIIINLLANLNI